MKMEDLSECNLSQFDAAEESRGWTERNESERPTEGNNCYHYLQQSFNQFEVTWGDHSANGDKIFV